MTAEQQTARDQIAAQVAEYLKNGGKIQVLESFPDRIDKIRTTAGPTKTGGGRDD